MLLYIKYVRKFKNSTKKLKFVKKAIEIYNTMLEPLLDKGIIIKGRNTDSFINNDKQNFIFELNKSKFENNPEKIKTLKIK